MSEVEVGAVYRTCETHLKCRGRGCSVCDGLGYLVNALTSAQTRPLVIRKGVFVPAPPSRITGDRVEDPETRLTVEWLNRPGSHYDEVWRHLAPVATSVIPEWLCFQEEDPPGWVAEAFATSAYARGEIITIWDWRKRRSAS